jgi:hypothetical protein
MCSLFFGAQQPSVGLAIDGFSLGGDACPDRRRPVRAISSRAEASVCPKQYQIEIGSSVYLSPTRTRTSSLVK